MCVPPFTDSTLDQALRWLGLAGGVWVWLGGTLLLLVSEHVPVFVAGGLAHCWVLRRHPVGVVLWSAPGLVVLTQPVVALVGGVVVVAMVRCWGVVVC